MADKRVANEPQESKEQGMTNEEAIKRVQAMITYMETLDADEEEQKDLEAYRMAVKALKHEPILGKIRAEIEHIIDYTYDSTDYDKSLYNGAYKDGLYEALDIIDKYKAESRQAETQIKQKKGTKEKL